MKEIKINFYCVGAQKAGTTSLHNVLNQHHNVFLPDTKEAHFFDNDEKFKLGEQWYYEKFFSNYKGETVCGSCNPDYLYFEDVPRRIFKSFGSDIKFVFLLRNPADRAYSHYLMSKRRCIENLPFENALEREASRIDKDYYNKSHYSYYTRGLYSVQIERYLKYFPKENMLFINFEKEFILNKNYTFSKILNFLDLDYVDLNIDVKRNVARTSKFKCIQKFIYKPNYFKYLFSIFFNQKFKNQIRRWLYILVMRPEKNPTLDNSVKKKLIQKYKSDIEKLQIITNKSFANWLEILK